jgi:hypothetical protein
MSPIARIPPREGSPTDVLAQLADLTDGLPFHEMDDDAAVVERAIRLAHQLTGAVSLDELLDLDVCQMAHEAYLHGDTQAALRTAFRAAIAKRGQ